MKKTIFIIIFCFPLIFFAQFGQVKPQSISTLKKSKRARIQYGTASFYDNAFNGKQTANGEIFNQKKFTAAHNNVPLGTWVRVTNLKNKKSVIVKVTDRLYKRNHRLIDLSRAAATRISFFKDGLLPVRIEVMSKLKPAVTSS